MDFSGILDTVGNLGQKLGEGVQKVEGAMNFGQQQGALAATTNNSMAVSQGITGKQTSSYFTPNSTASTTPATAGNVATQQAGKAAQAAQQTAQNQQQQQAQASQDQGTFRKKEWNLERVGKLLRALQTVSANKNTSAPGIGRGGSFRFDPEAYQNPLAARDFKQTYMEPEIQAKRW